MAWQYGMAANRACPGAQDGGAAAVSWLLRRLREPSTWRGLVWLATVAGLSLRPDQAEAIVTAGMALAGLLGVFTGDEPKNVSALPPMELQGRSDAGDAGADAGLVHAVDGLCQPVLSHSGPDSITQPNGGNEAGWGDR